MSRLNSQFDVVTSVMRKLRLLKSISRVELARQLSVSPSTVGIHVDRLVELGFLRQGHRQESGSGRPATLIELNPEAGQFIGIDLDSRQVHGVSVDFAQRVLRDRTVSVRSNESASDVLKLIDTVIDDVCDQSRDLLGIGIGVPGTVDIGKGIAIHYQFIRGWRNIPLVKRLEDRYLVPVQIENNIRAMAMAERWFGQGKEVENYICLGIRSGIGSGLILNGELYRGLHHLAGEVGGWPCGLSHDDDLIPLEQVASLTSILQRMTEGVRTGKPTGLSLFRGRVTVEKMLKAVSKQDEFCYLELARAGKLIGQVIAQMTLMLDPEKVIVAGPITGTGDAFLAPLRDSLKNSLPAMHAKPPEVTYSKLGELVGALGAAAIAVHAWNPKGNTLKSG